MHAGGGQHAWRPGNGRSFRSDDGAAPLITFTGVSKHYRGWNRRIVRALDNFSLDLNEGEIFGLAGPNGAGKSTMINLLLGFLAPTSGTVTIDGVAPRRFVEQHGIGYLSELVNVPPAWRVTDALRRYALLAGVPAETMDSRIVEAISQLGLEEHQDKRARQLSKGNLQRLGLAQALLCDQRVIVLDEPTHGLDPVWTQRFRDIVQSLRSPTRTILIASHNLDELERVADRVGIIDRGQLQRIVDMRTRSHSGVEGTPYRVLVREGEDRVLTHFPTAVAMGNGEFELTGVSLDALNTGVAEMIGQGARFVSINPVHSALEQQFRDAVRAQGDT